MARANPYLAVQAPGKLKPPYTFIPLINYDTPISRVYASVISFHFPQARTIYDPNCGTANHSFGPRLVKRLGVNRWVYDAGPRTYEYLASDILETPWNCLDGECVRWDYEREEPPYPERSFDIVFFDPPYTPAGKGDHYGRDYGLGDDVTVERVYRYYQGRPLERVASLARLGLVIKGQDFYWPTTSNRLHVFPGGILRWERLRELGFRPVGLYVVEIVRYRITLTRAALGQSMEARGYRRPMVKHGYLVVAVRG